MASARSSRQTDLYGALLSLYPQPFRQKYRATMRQTFADMLAAEHSAPGRLMVWARALADLPLSAAKEYITYGKEFSMNRTAKWILAGACVALVMVGAAAFWEGNLRARNSLGVEKVTAAQLADAMQQDRFYSMYGDTAVLFSAKVVSVTAQGNTSLVNFSTGRSYALVCQFPKTVAPRPGQTLSVAAPAGRAERQKQGVLLHNCLEN